MAPAGLKRADGDLPDFAVPALCTPRQYVELRIARLCPRAYVRKHGRGFAINAFDQTLAKTYRWLDDLDTSLGWRDRERCYRALKAVLHALRDRLPVAEAVDLGASMPMLVRGFYYEGWRPAATPHKYRDKEHFLAQVRDGASWLDPDDAERVVTAVFALLTSEIGGGEPDQVRRLLPPEVRELWALRGM